MQKYLAVVLPALFQPIMEFGRKRNPESSFPPRRRRLTAAAVMGAGIFILSHAVFPPDGSGGGKFGGDGRIRPSRPDSRVLFAQSLPKRIVDPKRPVATDDVVVKARKAFGRDAEDLVRGKSGGAYGVKGYDLRIGVGKVRSPLGKYGDRYPTRIKPAPGGGVSGYGKATGYTELWDRKRRMTGDPARDYDRWVNNWTEGFKESLVPGADPNQGKQWFKFYCIHCHGWAGEGDGPLAAMLNPKPRAQTFGPYMNKKSNVHLFKVIKGGGEFVELSPLMPAWGNIFQDQDIWNLVAYLRAIARPRYLPPKKQVTPLNAIKDDDFLEAQEFFELAGGIIGGRGIIKGGGKIAGGGRLYGLRQRTPGMK